MFKVHDSLLSALRTPIKKTIVSFLLLVQLKITSNLILAQFVSLWVFLLSAIYGKLGFNVTSATLSQSGD